MVLPFIAYSGIAFDLLIVPLLLWKKHDRMLYCFAYLSSVQCDYFTNWNFSVFALSFAVFLSARKNQAYLFKKKPSVDLEKEPVYQNKSVLLYFFLPYFILQIALPLRHWFIKGDVLWTEEGHRLSWRMMLRSRSGFTNFKIYNKKTNHRIFYDFNANLTRNSEHAF